MADYTGRVKQILEIIDIIYDLIPRRWNDVWWKDINFIQQKFNVTNYEQFRDVDTNK